MTVRQYDFLCPKPFEWFEVFPDGTVFVCCPSWLRQSVGNLFDSDIEQIWNSPKALEIRRSILDRSYSLCDHTVCPYLNAAANGRGANGSSLNLSGQFYSSEYLPRYPHTIACTFDRSCNLSCPSCRAETFLAKKDSKDMRRAVAIRNKVLDVLGHIKRLYITGSGDPFASPIFYGMLKEINLRRCPGLEILLITNGVLLKSRWSAISNVHSAIRSLEISIDAADARTYKAIRRGGNYKQLMESLDFASALRRGGQIENWRVSFVVQAGNFRQMPAFIQMGKRLQADSVYFARILNWGHIDAETFRRLDVAGPDNPDHPELLALLRDPVFEDPICDLGNLTHLRGSGTVGAPKTSLA